MQSAKPLEHTATWHVAPAHFDVPFAAKHAFPHPPQLFASVDEFTSHPFVLVPSQSARGLRHADTPHTPSVQLGVPPVVVHACPHPPQLSTFFVVSTSHPFDCTPSQSENPALHVIEQAPSAHAAVALFAEHAALHAEQFAGSASTFASHPSFGSPLQSAHPALQLATAHTPFEHSPFPFAGAQIAPHAPQLAGSRFLFASHPSAGSPLQSPRGARHVSIPHTPALHLAAALVNEHTFPHAPQFAASPSLFTSQPSAGKRLQSSKPAVQLAIRHAPSTQLSLAFSRSHTNPQPPQLAAFVWMFVSHPFVGSPSQSANPALHGPSSHFPALHPGSAFGSAAHAVPHVWQFAGSFSSSASHPSLLFLLQSANPGLQLPNSHAPATHAATLPGIAHAFPHAPQCAGVRPRSAHSLPQHASPDGHARPGAQPDTQRLAPTLHTVPSGQSPSPLHPTQACVAVSHRTPPPASGGAPALPSSPLSRTPPESAAPPPSVGLLATPTHSTSAVHPISHRSALEQYSPTLHGAPPGTHCTHVFVTRSHASPSGEPAQSASVTHPGAPVSAGPTVVPPAARPSSDASRLRFAPAPESADTAPPTPPEPLLDDDFPSAPASRASALKP